MLTATATAKADSISQVVAGLVHWEYKLDAGDWQHVIPVADDQEPHQFTNSALLGSKEHVRRHQLRLLLRCRRHSEATGQASHGCHSRELHAQVQCSQPGDSRRCLESQWAIESVDHLTAVCYQHWQPSDDFDGFLCVHVQFWHGRNHELHQPHLHTRIHDQRLCSSDRGRTAQRGRWQMRKEVLCYSLGREFL